MDQIRPWYKKKRFLIPIGVVGLLTVAGLSNPTPQTAVQQSQQSTPAVQQQVEQAPAVVAPIETPAETPKTETTSASQQQQLSNDNYYQNVSGNEVHSPAYTSDDQAPAGASAKCGDGTYSFSQHRSGTCSHHGGVAVWY